MSERNTVQSFFIIHRIRKRSRSALRRNCCLPITPKPSQLQSNQPTCFGEPKNIIRITPKRTLSPPATSDRSQFYVLSKFKHTEFMQYLLPPLSCGPSSKTCPKLPLQFLQNTSVRCPSGSRRVPTCSAIVGSVNEGQPVPESNFAPEPKRAAPQALQRQ